LTRDAPDAPRRRRHPSQRRRDRMCSPLGSREIPGKPPFARPFASAGP
jgi:hypothetical protein